MSTARLNAAFWKPGQGAEVPKQLAHDQAANKPASVSLSRLKPVMTHGEENHGPSPLKLPRWALNQICSKPRGNPSGTKTKIKGLFFFSAGAVSSLHCVFSPADAAAEQGREQKTA